MRALNACLLLAAAACLVGASARDMYPNQQLDVSFTPPDSNATYSGVLITVSTEIGADVILRCRPLGSLNISDYPWESSLHVGGDERVYINFGNKAFEDTRGAPENAVSCRIINDSLPPRSVEIETKADWVEDQEELGPAEQEQLVALFDTCCAGNGSCKAWKQRNELWVKSGNEGVYADFCHMPGQVCEPDGSLVQLNFEGYNLSCAFPGMVFASLGDLRTLALGQGHNFSGNWEKAFFELSSLKNLEVLTLPNNPRMAGQLSTSNEYGPLCSMAQGGLRVLDALNSSLTGPIPDCLVNTTSTLTFLRLGFNRLNGSIPDVFGGKSPLAWLTINANQLSGSLPPSLGSLQQLAMLNVSDNRLSGPLPKELADSPLLMHILARSNGLEGDIPDEIALAPQLITIDLRNNRMSGMPRAWAADSEELRALKLQALRLANNSFSGPVPKGLPYLADLLDLNLAANAFNGTLPVADVVTSFPNMLMFNMSQNALTGEIPEDYSQMRMFRQMGAAVNTKGGVLVNWTFVFDVSSNDLSGDLPEFLSAEGMGDRANWTQVNMTSAGTFGNACEPAFAYINGTCDDSSAAAPSQDEPEASTASSEDSAEESSDTASESSSDDDSDDSGGGLSGGAIFGIVVAVLAGVALIGALAFVIVKRKRAGAALLPSASLGRGPSAFTKFEEDTASSVEPPETKQQAMP